MDSAKEAESIQVQGYTITPENKIGDADSTVCTAMNSRQEKFAAKLILAHNPQSI